jgi:hypothetical protein
MSLIKQTIIDKVEIVGDFKTIQVREKISVLEDGNEISSSSHRLMYQIFDYNSISDLPENIQPYAQGIWTEDLYALAEQEKAARQAEWEQTQVPA